MGEHIMKILRYLYYFRSTAKFKKAGKNLHFSKGGMFIRPREIEMGSNVFISNNFHISAYKLKFGSNIMIGPNLVIECTNHKMCSVGKTMYDEAKIKDGRGVSIEDDVWMGANVVILPDVVISEGAVIGAGSIVTRSLPPYSVCVGTPCKPVKKRFSVEEMKQHLGLIKTSKYSFAEILDQWKLYNL